MAITTRRSHRRRSSTHGACGVSSLGPRRLLGVHADVARAGCRSGPAARSGSLPAAHSRVWPGRGRVGVRVDVQRPVLAVVAVLVLAPSMYGRCDGTASPPSTSSMTTTLKRSAVPLPKRLCQRAPRVAQEQRHVVARRLHRGQERQRRAQALDRQGQAIEAAAGRPVFCPYFSRLLDRLSSRSSSCLGARAGCWRRPRTRRPAPARCWFSSRDSRAQLREQLRRCRSGTTARSGCRRSPC